MLKKVLFLNGIPDSKVEKIMKIKQNGDLVRQGSGNANIGKFLENEHFKQANISFDTNKEQRIPNHKVHAVFNQITDADSHTITLKKAEVLYKKISHDVPFFNPPSHIMKTTRENIYQILHKIDKLNVPKTVRIRPKSPDDIYHTIDEENFSFPIIFRQAGDHGGISTKRIEDKTDQFYEFALDGRDYYLTQFVDYVQKGIYTKYRLVVVNGEVFIRHVIFSDTWIIHSNSRKFMEQHPEYQKKEAALLESFESNIKPHIQPIVDKIYHQLNLDYFGIDCYLDEHFNMTLFETNANMNILVNNASKEKNIWDDQIKKITNAIIKMITQRLKI